MIANARIWKAEPPPFPRCASRSSALTNARAVLTSVETPSVWCRMSGSVAQRHFLGFGYAEVGNYCRCGTPIQECPSAPSGVVLSPRQSYDPRWSRHCHLRDASSAGLARTHEANGWERTMKARCVLLVMLSLASLTAMAQAIPVPSVWTNQRGSMLYLDAMTPNGQITGHYINRAQGTYCQNIAYPLVGWIYGTAITFTVDWQGPTESCNSITSWTGFLYQNNINTLWQLVVNGSTSTQQIMQGSDVFSPSQAVTRKSLMQSQ
jgi:hypothetical protein